MVNYIRTESGETSVKTMGVVAERTPVRPGVVDFTVRPVFSVFDYGTIEPPVPLDNSTITLMAAVNFETLWQQGIPSHYIGLVHNDEVISAREAIAKGVAPTTMRVVYVNRVMPQFVDGKWVYVMYQEGSRPANNYVHPLELISRDELPESASVWGRIKRGETTLAELGLPEDMKPGMPIPDAPFLDYTTKFEKGDKGLTKEQARLLAGLSPERFSTVNETTRRASRAMTDYAASRGFKRLDGKVEQITVPDLSSRDIRALPAELQTWYHRLGSHASFEGQFDVLGDFVCTWHEDRLVTPEGLGISKQRIRDKVKALNPAWYNDIEQAKKDAIAKGVKDFRTLMDPSIEYVSPSEEFFHGVNRLFQAGTNQWVGAKVYEVYPDDGSLTADLKRATEEFQQLAKAK